MTAVMPPSLSCGLATARDCRVPFDASPPVILPPPQQESLHAIRPPGDPRRLRDRGHRRRRLCARRGHGARTAAPNAPPPAAAAAAPTAGTAGRHRRPPRIRFARGTTSGILDDSLAAGATRSYLVGARRGQVMLAHAIAWPVAERLHPPPEPVVRVFAAATGTRASLAARGAGGLVGAVARGRRLRRAGDGRGPDHVYAGGADSAGRSR